VGHCVTIMARIRLARMVFFRRGMADPRMEGEGIGQLPATATGETGSADTVMIESEAGGDGGSAAGQQVPAVADAAGEREVEEDERVRRAAEAAQVANDNLQQDIWVTGALMVRGAWKEAQELAEFLEMSVTWRGQRGDCWRGDFKLYKLSKRLKEAAAARAAGGWLNRRGALYRFDVAGKERDKLAATDAPVRPQAELRMPGAVYPGSRPANPTNPWLNPNPMCRAQQPAHHPAADVITAAVTKEVAATVKELLDHHRAQEMALMQAALQTARQAAQTAQ